MLCVRAARRASATVSIAVLLALATAVVPRYALAQEPTPGAAPQAERVTVSDERFPWWDVLTGVGTVGLAGAALYAAVVSLTQYLRQRRRETDLDLAKLQGDLVLLLQQECERAKGGPDEGVRRQELEGAQDVYEGILRGIILARPELMKAGRETLTEYLKEATSELRSLKDRGG